VLTVKKKPLPSLFLMLVLVGGMWFVSTPFLGIVKASTSINGIISSDTAWTKANSPYDLTGNVLIDSGVTVTVEADVVVNLNGYYIRVNGTLIIQSGVNLNMGMTGTNVGNIQVNGVLTARGTSTNPIHFNGGTYHWDSLFVPPSVSYVTFSAFSKAWNEQTATGCIIEKAVMNKTGVTISSSIKYANNQLSDAGLGIIAGSPVISNNEIPSGISISGGSPVIANNNLNNGYVWMDGSSSIGSPIIVGNVISNTNPQWPYATVAGIAVLGYPFYDSGQILIEKNVINGSSVGIDLIYRESQDMTKPLTIRYNTIISNGACISIAGKFSPTIANNNFYSNNTCLKLSPASRDVTAAQNYWGTTDSSEIDRLIYDFNDDFNLGKVNYTPFLTEPNTQAMPDPAVPIPTLDTTPSTSPSTSPETSPSPSTSPDTSNSPATNSTATDSTGQIESQALSQLEIQEIVIVALVVVVVVLAIIVLWMHLRSRAEKKSKTASR
jgi:hypothetical protein